jgi:cell division cycle 20, cofactor of APC complex
MDFLFSSVPNSPHSGRKRRSSSEKLAEYSPSPHHDSNKQKISLEMSPPSSPHRSRPGFSHGSIPGWATPPKSPRSPFTSPKGDRRRSNGGMNTEKSIFSFDHITPTKGVKSSGSGANSPTTSQNRHRSTSGGNLINSVDSDGGGSCNSANNDRYIPNRDSVDFDMAGHILNNAITSDENTCGLSGSFGSNSTNGINSSTKSTKVSTSNSRTHLGVISNANNINTTNRLLCFGDGNRNSSGKSTVDMSYLDDGFNRIKDDKHATESNNEIATGAAAAVAAAIGINITNGGISNSHQSRGKCRYIPSQPSRILDAPDLMDDYYLNLLSWGSNNVIAVALNQSVYLWHASDGHIDNLMTLNDDEYVTSVQWATCASASGRINDSTIAIGTSGNVVELWDASKLSKIRDLQGHTNRVSSLSWAGSSGGAAGNSSILSSGGRDGCVINHDVRCARNVMDTLQGHTQEVCGLAWSPDGLTLASGGNENRLCLWDAAMSSSRSNSGGTSTAGTSTPRYVIEQHNAAVKAVAWCPWQRNVLASGGGTADRTIRIWNASIGTNLRTVDTGS